jgi:predicted DNA-binding protein with PD1-like motif
VHLTNVEALGCGTIARDDAGGILPHIHTSVGLKEHSATGHTSHLLAAKVQFLTEMIVVEADAPVMTPPRSRPLRSASAHIRIEGPSDGFKLKNSLAS